MPSQQPLQASYTGPDTTGKDFIYELPRLSAAPYTTDRTAYLSALRSSVQELQGQVNTFLTQKMEEEKAIAAAGAKTVDESKEEENYGEEVVEDGDG